MVDSGWNSHSPLTIYLYEPTKLDSEPMVSHARLVVCGLSENVKDAAFLLQTLGLLDDSARNSIDNTSTDGTA